MRGADIARTRAALGCDQRRFAKLIGVSQYRLSRLEFGIVDPDVVESSAIDRVIAQLRAERDGNQEALALAGGKP